MKKNYKNKLNELKKKNFHKFKKQFHVNFNKNKRFLLDELKDILNYYHKKKYSKKQWQFIIGYWLDEFLRTYTFYENLNKNTNLKKFILNKKIENMVIPHSFNDYLKLSYEKNFFYFLISSLNKKKNNFNFTRVKSVKLKIKNPLRFLYIKIINLFIRKNSVLLFASRFSKKRIIFLTFRSFLKLLFYPKLNSLFDEEIEIIPNNRNRIIKISKLSKNIDLLKLVLNIMPSFYLESFKELDKINLISNNKDVKVYTDTCYIDDEIFNTQISKKNLKQKKILIGQHGGNFLIYDKYALSSHENDICKKFFTWGCFNQKKFKHLTPPRLLEYFEKNKNFLNKKKNFEVCYVTRPLVESEFQSFVFENFNSYENISNIKIFIKNCKKKTIIKTYPETNRYPGQITDKQLRKKLNISKSLLSNDKNIIFQSEIIIFDYVSTMLFENLNLGIPFILILKKENHYFSKIGLNFTKDLDRINLLFRDHNSASEFINRLPSIKEWWNKKKSIVEFKKLIRKYAKLSPSYEKQWIRL